MNSGDLKTYKYVKISKSNFFTITMLSLHSICSESKKTSFWIVMHRLRFSFIKISRIRNLSKDALFLRSLNIRNFDRLCNSEVAYHYRLPISDNLHVLTNLETEFSFLILCVICYSLRTVFELGSLSCILIPDVTNSSIFVKYLLTNMNSWTNSD